MCESAKLVASVIALLCLRLRPLPCQQLQALPGMSDIGYITYVLNSSDPGAKPYSPGAGHDNSDFTCTLGEPLNLPGAWECCLVSTTFQNPSLQDISQLKNLAHLKRLRLADSMRPDSLRTIMDGDTSVSTDYQQSVSDMLNRLK